MLQYTIIFLIIATIAGVFGFTSIAGAFGWIAQILFGVFIVLAIISFVTGRKV